MSSENHQEVAVRPRLALDTDRGSYGGYRTLGRRITACSTKRAIAEPMVGIARNRAAFHRLRLMVGAAARNASVEGAEIGLREFDVHSF
jgi:hypothetical protein